MSENKKPENGRKGTLREELGRRISQKRKRRGWSQGELARRMGVFRERVSKWERGEHAPTLEDLVSLSRTLEVPLEELGLGCAAGESLSPLELGEMVSHLKAIGRLLKPWLDRQGAPAPKKGK